MCVYLWGYVHIGARREPQWSSGPITFTEKTEALTKLELIQQSRLVYQQAPGIYLPGRSLSAHYEDYKHIHHIQPVLSGFWGLCLQGNHFTYWGIAPAMPCIW